MKALDEVIDKLEKADTTWCNIRGNLNYEDFRDALHYLKEYKKNQEDPDGDHQQLEKAQKLLWEFYQNDPLTWDELKQMEGKPVWVEEYSRFFKQWRGGWEVIMCVCDAEYDDDPYLSMSGDEYRHEYDLGKSWRAYRKELGCLR